MKYLTSLIVLLLVGCSSEQPEAPPIVVFLATEDVRIVRMLSEFSAETDIPVEVRRGSAAELADALINKVGTPADLFIADSVAEHWRATDGGALRPIASDALARHHASLRDPDGFWFALEIRPHAIVRPGATEPARVSYDDLGSPEFSGRVCLSSSSLASNRALLANLVEARGELETERLVRRWIRNLAQPPYASSDALRQAIQAGTCEFGIAGNPHTVFGNWNVTPEPHSYEVTTVGVGRHARQPDAAQSLADWLLVNKSVRVPSFAELPRAGVAGWRDAEVRLLAERAGYR